MSKYFTLADFKTNSITISKKAIKQINDFQKITIIGTTNKNNSDFSVWLDENFSNGVDSIWYFDNLSIENAIIEANKMIY